MNNEKDDQALRIVKTVFSEKTIETFNINKIGQEGGLLNCISWNIKSVHS
jgi:agmatine deiminase